MQWVGVGFAWYDESDYLSARKMMTDKDSFPLTYSAWLRESNEKIVILRRRGLKVIKVQLRPQAFAIWCNHLQLETDAGARMRYANEVASNGADKATSVKPEGDPPPP